ncbi:MAG: cyclic nucleotide-binding domain-containing protein [Oscillatoria sp. SIO1A7]|nr:cyclic nucleotide-binding domain-containing protein [Oscillatoria sp. SIO1A7]
MNLESHRFISYFEREQADELCELAVLERFPEQGLIFEENEIPDSLYLVLDGEVEFGKRTGPGQYQVIAVARPNEFFGEFGVLDGQPRSARAVASKDGATLAKIPRETLMEILQRSPGTVVLRLFRHIIQYLRSTTERYVDQVVHKQKMAVVGEMVNTIVHDFKSPVTGIQLASSMLKEMHIDEDTQEWCELIQAQVTRMLAMAEEVLEFTRGSSVLHKKPVNLADTLRQFEKLNRVYFKDANVEFVMEAKDLWVNADEGKLMRVWQNLVSNAVDALEGCNGRIEIATVAREGWVEIDIADNGSGIPEAIRDRLFEPFITYGKRGGTGLGTAIAKSIIDAHGGEIDFTSSDTGTTFYIRLPIAKQDNSEKASEKEALAKC